MSHPRREIWSPSRRRPVRLDRPARLAAVAAGLAIASPSAANDTLRCNQKLYNTLFDRAPTAAELSAPDPRGRIDTLLADEEFQDTFARFVNARMNWGPEDNRERNPVYNMVREYILKRGHPWEALFTAQVDVVGQNVNPSSNTVGYFENRHWKRRYAGNEEDGYKLRTAYMIMNNVIGLNLEAITVTANGGSSRDDREDPNRVCYSCHVAADFALDKVARILDRVDRQASDAQNTIFKSPEGPAQVVYGREVGSLRELVQMLVSLDSFDNQACRVAFAFVFGREEGGTEPAVFDGCLEQFRATGHITDALRHLVRSDLFCPGL